MKITILKRAVLEEVPSASALEVLNGLLYIAADDASGISVLKDNLRKIKYWPLPGLEAYAEGVRIPKPLKPDLEAGLSFNINGYPHLVFLGSGSVKTYRDKAYLIKLPTPYNRNPIVWEKNLEPLYNLIRQDETAMGLKGELNIEAGTLAGDKVIIVNRSSNAALIFDEKEFAEFIQGHTEGFPFPSTEIIEVKETLGLDLHISGLCTWRDKLIFTLSAEDTPNAYDDGAIMGSALAWASLNEDSSFSRGMRNAVIGALQGLSIIEDEKGEPLKTKLESISVYEEGEDGTLYALAIADNDDQAAELFQLELRF
jgi:hypothetical protein